MFHQWRRHCPQSLASQSAAVSAVAFVVEKKREMLIIKTQVVAVASFEMTLSIY